MSQPPIKTCLAAAPRRDFRVSYERHVQAVVAYVGRRTYEPELVLDVLAGPLRPHNDGTDLHLAN